MLDIIIPVLNEENILNQRHAYFDCLSKQANLVFVDGGSNDQTIALASQFGMVLQSYPPRSVQKNYGATHTQTPYLLFLNVDTIVQESALQKIPAYLNDNKAGCFCMRIDDQGLNFRFYEWLVNFRARAFGAIDADLGLMIRRDFFEQLGRFDELPIMDDIAFSKKLRRRLKITPLQEDITVSARKWREKGFFKTLGIYTLAYLKFWMGIIKLDDKKNA